MSTPPPKLVIEPPLLNTACPWATTYAHLHALYASPATGAITTRTSLLEGFAHDGSSAHQFLFFDPADPSSSRKPDAQDAEPGKILDSDDVEGMESQQQQLKGSLNSLGYSPLPLDEYEGFIRSLRRDFPAGRKPIIVSVTGTPSEVATCVGRVEALAREVGPLPLAVEINLSCPNIAGRPPPAYDGDALRSYLTVLPPPSDHDHDGGATKTVTTVPVGLKTPPYTHAGQFHVLIDALLAAPGKISFLTATNTLGSCLILGGAGRYLIPALPSGGGGGGGGLGGMAGPSLHPLALGNVATLRRMLDEAGGGDGTLRQVQVLGVGGVCDRDGLDRMRSVGAAAVGVATALGREGVGVFEQILGV